jgi:uncharacterized protein with HEPN domain
MSNRTPKLLLEDILTSSHKILSYTKELTYEQFLADDKTIDAVIRNFEIIGEASNRLTEEFRDQHLSVEWHRIRGFRNRIVHDYMGIDYKILWNIKENFLPLLIDQVKSINEKI